MKSTKLVIAALYIAILSGCAATYTFEGRKFENKETFHAAVESTRSMALSNVQPLPKPLTEKGLIFAMPNAEVLVLASKKNFTKIQGRAPMGIEDEILENLPRANHKMSVIFGEAIAKRGIFSSVKQISIDSLDSSIQPTEKEDVIYYTEPTIGSGQWFYSSAKHGRQVFAFDRSRPGTDGKLAAFLEAVQVQAIRD